MKGIHSPTTSVEAASRALKIALLQRGWTTVDLAEKTGISPGEIRKIACGGSATRFGRRKIEAALGIPIWSTPAEHRMNERVASLLGIDPILRTPNEIKRSIREANFNISLVSSKTVLLQQLKDLARGKISPASRTGFIFRSVKRRVGARKELARLTSPAQPPPDAREAVAQPPRARGGTS